MWKNLDLLIGTLPDAYAAFSLNRIGEAEFEEFPPIPPDMKYAASILLSLFKGCKELFENGSSLPTSEARDRVNQYYVDFLLTIVNQVEKLGQYKLISDLWQIYGEMLIWGILPGKRQRNVAHDSPIYILRGFFLYSINFIHLAVGSEDTVLIGTKGGPSWRRLRKPLKTRLEINEFKFSVTNRLNDVSPAEADFIPDPDKQVRDYKQFDAYIPEFKSLRSILSLLEDAWANFRYVPNPEGSIVAFNDRKCPFKSMLIKVFPCPEDDKSLGIMARIEHEDGALFFSYNNILWFLEERPSPFPSHDKLDVYIIWLCVQIYHDLVTAKHIRVRKPSPASLSKKAKAKREKKESYESGWTYIPRVVYDRELPIRTKLLESREPYTPRYVRMHRRHVNMSEKQREAIQEFEAKYGIQVLRFIPDGYTVVRPYISPTISQEEWDRLPKYIKARIQLDLEEALRQIANPTAELLENIFEKNGSEEEQTN